MQIGYSTGYDTFKYRPPLGSHDVSECDAVDYNIDDDGLILKFYELHNNIKHQRDLSGIRTIWVCGDVKTVSPEVYA